MYYEIVGTRARLLGSLHQWPAVSGPSELPQWVWGAYDWSEQLYLEADLSEAERFVRLSDGATLEGSLPPSIWDALKAVLPPRVDFSPIKPWAALLALQYLGTPMVGGVEPLFTARGHQEAKPIRYLETLAEFAARLDAASAADYAQAFTYLLQDLDGIRRVLQEMRGVWLDRCVEEIEAILPRTLMGIPVVSQLILDERNVAWLPRIQAAVAANRRTLIVVGAAHLPREKGLLALLSQAGRPLRLISE